jgi:hypothetical protein
MRLWKRIINVAERAFVEGAFTPSVRLVALASVHFAMPTELAKHKKKKLKK